MILQTNDRAAARQVLLECIAQTAREERAFAKRAQDERALTATLTIAPSALLAGVGHSEDDSYVNNAALIPSATSTGIYWDD